MANFLTNSFSAGAGSLVDAVGDAIEKNIASDEERKERENEINKASMEYDIEMATLSVDERKAFVADTANARENQSRTQESGHAGWLAKNIHPMLAIGIIGLTFLMYFWMVWQGEEILENNAMKEIIIYILGALTTVSTQVAAFYFGSSQGSKDKQKSLSEIAMNVNR